MNLDNIYIAYRSIKRRYFKKHEAGIVKYSAIKTSQIISNLIKTKAISVNGKIKLANF